jgi:F-type H+-transporting ATPase subunit delta
MSEYRIASRYAKSLIDLSQENNILDEVNGNIDYFLKVHADNVGIQALLKNPIVSIEKKQSILKSVFSENTNPLTMLFYNLVVKKGRSKYLPLIAKEFVNQYNVINNISFATVKTASALDAQTSKEIKDFISKSTGKTIKVTEVVDPSLIGGVWLKIEDKLYDASISGSLRKAKKQLLNTYISK